MLGLNPSTVTRYLQQHPDLNRGTKAEPDVDIDELRRHRAENVNPAMSGNHAGLLQDQLDFPDDPEELAAPEQPPSRQVEARTRAAEAQATRLELDLAERKGLVVDRAGVEMAFRTVGVALTQALESRQRPLAEEFAGMSDARAIALRLDEEDRAMLTRVREELRKALGPPPTG